MSSDHQNPYASPQSEKTVRNTVFRPQVFYGLYAVCFVLAVALWFASGLVRKIDLLELPMEAMLFPLAMFIDPNDGLVNRPEWVVPGGALCWLAVIPLAFRAAVTPIRRLLAALGILAAVAMLSTLYAVVIVLIL